MERTRRIGRMRSVSISRKFFPNFARLSSSSGPAPLASTRGDIVVSSSRFIRSGCEISFGLPRLARKPVLVSTISRDGIRGSLHRWWGEGKVGEGLGKVSLLPLSHQNCRYNIARVFSRTRRVPLFDVTRRQEDEYRLRAAEYVHTSQGAVRSWIDSLARSFSATRLGNYSTGDKLGGNR